MKIGSSLPRPQQRDTGPYQVLCNSHSNYLFFSCHGSHIWPGRPLWLSSITLRHTTTCKTRLDEWSDRRRDLYPTTHNARKRQTTMTPAGFKRAIPASERPQTQATLKLHCLKIQSVLPIPPITNIYIYTTWSLFQLNFVWSLFLSHDLFYMTYQNYHPQFDDSI